MTYAKTCTVIRRNNINSEEQTLNPKEKLRHDFAVDLMLQDFSRTERTIQDEVETERFTSQDAEIRLKDGTRIFWMIQEPKETSASH